MTENAATAEIIAEVTKKAQRATQNVAAIRSGLVQMVTDGASGVNLAGAANNLAAAEGAEHYWARMLHVAEYAARTEADDAMAMLQSETNSILLSGADDEWSGRGNDAKRSRFDGIRNAASDLRYLV